MESVKLFNQELSSLYEIKPPISKAKMTSITKGAIRSIKYYKHVVQSVEKFIQKCRQEYKIPGLYVIDSIVRQSRHQFGPEKDVFAPRFAKNIQLTFFHLYKCSEDEKSKVIRVLNLWQKNEVFLSEIIQPLFDLANPNSELSKKMEDQLAGGGKPKITINAETQNMIRNEPDISQDPIQQQLQTIHQLLRQTSEVKFNKKVLEFDYSDDEGEGGGAGNAQDEVQPTQATLDALQALISNEAQLEQLKAYGGITTHQIQQLKQLLPQAQKNFHPSPATGSVFNNLPYQQQESGGWPQASAPALIDMTVDQDDVPNDGDVEILDDGGGRWRGEGKSRWGSRRSRSRSPRRSSRRGRRSRSRSYERRSSRRRSRSRSRSKDRRDREAEREKRREREKKGLPPIKKGYLSGKTSFCPIFQAVVSRITFAVCSTTLWVGHLSKLVAEEDLSDMFGQFGEIITINLIPPRGCAFICMNRRMDATKALKSLHKQKLHGKPITVKNYTVCSPIKAKWQLSLQLRYLCLF